MQASQGLYVMILAASMAAMGAGCGKSDSGKDDLRRENDALRTQLAAEQARANQLQDLPLGLEDLSTQLASLKSETATKEAEIEAQKAEIETLKTSNNAGAADAIKVLEDKIKTSESEISDAKLLVSKLEIAASEKADDLAMVFKGSMTPYAGIWILNPQPELAFGSCQYMVRFDAEQGNVYRAVICEDGKIQAERQTLTGFAAKNSAGWNGTVGFNMESATRKSSCQAGQGLFASGTSYGFDHSVGTATAANEAALFMTSNIGADVRDFASGSTVADLGKNKSCGTIITRAKQSSQAGNLLLQQAAKVCQITPELTGAGCFVAADQFEPSL